MDALSNAQEVQIALDLGARSHPITVTRGRSDRFGPFARSALARTWSGSACRQALLVTDQNVADLGLPQPFEAALEDAGIEPSVAVVPAGEGAKSLEQASRLYDELVGRSSDRHTLVVAIGGGVVGDLAGFVAATYARGLPWILVPTTLLAQVDSSVGGKVGVNHPRVKNIIGAFHQPVGVWIDTCLLATLPDRELSAGLAEVVKYGVILDSGLFSSLEGSARELLARDQSALEMVVVRSVELKTQVVGQDEREETGRRAILNFGHTIGHAIEAVAGYDGAFRHGEAVAAGMVAECRLAERLGWIGGDCVDRLERLVTRLGLPAKAPGLDPGGLLAAIHRDKKNQGGRVRFVLPRSLGSAELTDLPGESDIRAIILSLSAASAHSHSIGAE
jgi:3-dehydroquinate synthase